MSRILKLPVGISSFEVLRENGFLYVDKTAAIYRMVDEGRYYFLARPRRFGKSLLVSTLRCLFEGRRELFTGLWLADARCRSQVAYLSLRSERDRLLYMLENSKI